MSIIGEIKGLIDAAKAIKSDADLTAFGQRFATNKRYSLATLSNDAVLHFPVIASRSLDIDTLQIISKSLERNYATFTQIAISLDGVVDTATSKNVNPRDIIRQFHTSHQPSTDIVVDVGDVYSGTTESLNRLHKKLMTSLEESLNMLPLNKLYKPVVSYKYNFNDPKLNEKYNALREGIEDYDPDTKMTALRAKNDKELKDHPFHNMLQDNDVKKSNELMATMLHVKVKLVNTQEGSSLGVVDFLIGIKTMLHPVTSQEMVTNLAECYRNNNLVFQFLRWTTGEISFIKDLILNLDDTKRSVIDESTKNASPWWNHLKRLRNASGLAKAMSPSNRKLIPNTTIVVSRQEVEVIKERYGYDLSNADVARSIMDNYFLLGFVIVDTSVQAASFLFDGRKDFETISFSGLERENTASERKFKEMLKAVNRV